MRQRITITENERKDILNLHKKYVTEQYSGAQTVITNPQTATGAQPTGSNVQTSINVSQDQMKAKIEFLQGKLNDKYKAGLKVDGKWGPKTAAAVQKALASLTPAAGTTPTSGETITTVPGTASSRFQQTSQNLLNQNPLQRQTNLGLG